jgi:hypothetical protein
MLNGLKNLIANLCQHFNLANVVHDLRVKIRTVLFQNPQSKFARERTKLGEAMKEKRTVKLKEIKWHLTCEYWISIIHRSIVTYKEATKLTDMQ